MGGMGDKRVVNCTATPGTQPGDYRLVPGECFAGGLSRGFSPRGSVAIDVTSEVRWSKAKRRAEIQIIKEDDANNNDNNASG